MMAAGAYVPRGVDAHPGDSHTVATCSSDEASSVGDRGLPQALSMFLELREERRDSRRSWCLFAFRRPRAFLRTPRGRLLCLRGLGLLALALAAAAIGALRAQEQITASLAYRGVGTCLGIAPALLRTPGASSGSPLPWRRRLVLAALIVGVALALVLEPLQHQEVWEEDKTVKSYLVNLASMALLTPLAVTAVCMWHPTSPYFRDAIWCTVGFWLIAVLIQLGVIARFFAREADEEAEIHRLKGPQIGYIFWTASYNLEGVVFTWVARLMATRIRALEALGGGISFVTRYSTPMLLIMSAAFHCKMSCEMLFELTEWQRWKAMYTIVTLIFLSMWALYSGVLAALLVHGLQVLRAHSHTRSAPQAEARWAANILGIELLASLLLCSTTMGNWLIKLVYMLEKELDVPRGEEPAFIKVIVTYVEVAHKMDYIVNAYSIAVLSGLIWQPAMPRGTASLQAILAPMRRRARSADRSALSPASARVRPCQREVYRTKVRELAYRGIRLDDLLTFWEVLLAGKIMPWFDPARSTTNDVVRQVIIPMSRKADPRLGGSALASIWNNDALVANNMVTHNWSNLFWHLVAAVVADQLEQTTYAEVAEGLLDASRVRRLRRDLASRGALGVTYWICAFAINQHSGICGGFGPAPSEADPQKQAEKMADYEAKCRDTVTGEVFKVCDCSQPKFFNDQPAACEMNKFDDMMNLLATIHRDQHPRFSHLIVVDAGFDVFRRAWCVAEIVESDLSEIDQRMKIHSQESLDIHYNSLLRLDVRDCEASRSDDKDMILARIGRDNIEAFNDRLAWAVLGTDGLINKWYDGQQRAAQVGRILQRARTASEDKGTPDAGRKCRPRSKTASSSQSTRLPSRWMDSFRFSASIRSLSLRTQPTAEHIGRRDSDSSDDSSADDEFRETA